MIVRVGGGPDVTTDRSRDATFYFLSLLLALALAGWFMEGVWGRLPPSGGDTAAHLVRTQFGIENLFAQGRIDGWFPRVGLGHQEFLFYGPGFTLAVAIVRVATVGLVSTTGAFKVVVVGSCLLLPLSTAYLARSAGLSRRTAGLSAVLSLGVSSYYGVGWEGTFFNGFLPQQLAASLFCLSLGALLRLTADRRPRTAAIAGISTAALAVVHPYTLLILGPYAIFCVVFAERRAVGHGWMRFRATLSGRARDGTSGAVSINDLDTASDNPQRSEPSGPAAGAMSRPGLSSLLAVAGLVAVGLSAFWLVPAVVHRDLRGPLTGFETPGLRHRLVEIWQGKRLFQPRVAWVFVLGWLFALVAVVSRRPRALALLLAPAVFLLAAHGVSSSPVVPDYVHTLANRGLGLVGVLIVVGVAASLAATTASLGKVGDVVALVVAALLVAAGSGAVHRGARQLGPPSQPMQSAARELSKEVPAGARFATERFEGEEKATGEPVPPFWLSWAAERNVLAAFDSESSTAAVPMYESDNMTHIAPEEAATRLARLGVSHVVTTTEASAERFRQSPRFRQTWTSSPVAIFAIVPQPGWPEPSSLLSTGGPTSAGPVRGASDHLIVEARSSDSASATLAVAWSPKWHLRINGRGVRFHRADDGLLAFVLPAGPSRIELDYRSDLWDLLGLMLTLLTVLILLFRSRPSKVRGRVRLGIRRVRGAGVVTHRSIDAQTVATLSE